MTIDKKVFLPVRETNYLGVDNVKRYRIIMRLFYLEYMKLNYWLDTSYVHDCCKVYFEDDYTYEMCRGDLEILIEWGNLDAVQDTKSISTLEDFKNKRFRYQMSKYSVEIERMLSVLENMSAEKGSLEPSLLDTLAEDFEFLNDIEQRSDHEIFGWWEKFGTDFRILNERYLDFLRDLGNITMDNEMNHQRFLLIKDRIIEYLRSFISKLHGYEAYFRTVLSELDDELMERIFPRLLEYKKNIPAIDDLDDLEYMTNLRGKWDNIMAWFVGTKDRNSELLRVFNVADEIIMKITRYAFQIASIYSGGVNRKELYHKLADLFHDTNDISQCHIISSRAFGISRSFHFKSAHQRETESQNIGTYDESPIFFELKPRTRKYKEAMTRPPIRNMTREKKERMLEFIRAERKKQEVLDSLIANGVIDFAELKSIEPHVRNQLLKWVSSARQNTSRKSRTDDGRSFTLEENYRREILLKCTDGDFYMPHCKLVFGHNKKTDVKST